MKSRIAAVVLVLAAVSLVVGWTWPIHAQQSSAVRWEYCVVGPEWSRSAGLSGGMIFTTSVYYLTPQGSRTETVETSPLEPGKAESGSGLRLAIAKLGMDGWEMVQMAGTQVYLKRQIR